jgi:carbonic anhydrase
LAAAGTGEAASSTGTCVVEHRGRTRQPAPAKCHNFGSVLPIREEPAMTTTDDLLKNAERHAEGFDKGDLPMPPAKKVAIVACMDARVNPYPIFGLELGDAHVIRNAGGVVTDDEIRSLSTLSGSSAPRKVILMHHTDCGMLTFNDEDFRRDIEEDTGIKPSWSPEAFDDLEADVRQSINRIQSGPVHPQQGLDSRIHLRGRNRPSARGHVTRG